MGESIVGIGMGWLEAHDRADGGVVHDQLSDQDLKSGEQIEQTVAEVQETRTLGNHCQRYRAARKAAYSRRRQSNYYLFDN